MLNELFCFDTLLTVWYVAPDSWVLKEAVREANRVANDRLTNASDRVFVSPFNVDQSAAGNSIWTIIKAQIFAYVHVSLEDKFAKGRARVEANTKETFSILFKSV